MKKTITLLCCIIITFVTINSIYAQKFNCSSKQEITALYIPLADHYAGLIAYENYKSKMKCADFKIIRMNSWPSLKGKFNAKLADVAFIISPLAMDMYANNPHFKWVSLIHRDGNALAANKLLTDKISLQPHRKDRKPDKAFANALLDVRGSISGVPSLFATHTVILYKYLKDNGKTLCVGKDDKKCTVVAKAVAPPKSPAFLKQQEKAGKPATFEQSLPWADVVETKGFGKVIWYSKDVLPTEKGHVECIIIAQNSTINNKTEALKEVIYFIHKAGQDIEDARLSGKAKLGKIADQIRKHIPEHNKQAIIESLNIHLDVIKFTNLNVDKPGIKTIMDLAVEGKVLKKKINIDSFTDESFKIDVNQFKHK